MLGSYCSSLGYLSCVSAGNIQIENNFTLKCAHCDFMKIVQRQTSSLAIPSSYMLLLNSLSDEVVRSFLTSLPRVLSHCCTHKQIEEKVLHVLPKLVGNSALQTDLAKFLQFICRNNGTFFPLNNFMIEVKKLLAETISWDVQETVLITFGYIGEELTSELLFCILSELIRYLANPNSQLRTLAFNQLQRIASRKKTTIKSLLLSPEIKDFFFKFIASSKIVKQEGLLEEVCLTLLEQMNPKEILELACPIQLPNFFATEEQKLQRNELVVILARKLGKPNPATFLLDYVPAICCHLLISNNPKSFISTVTYIAELARTTPQELIRTCLSDIVHGLLYQLGDINKKAYVVKSLNIIRDTIGDKEDLDVFLRSQFLSAMDFFNRKFDQSNDVNVKRQIAACLSQLFPLIGSSSLSSVAPKVMATLEILSKDTNLLVDVCYAWSSFLTHVEPNSLGPMLSKIIVDLLPLVKEPSIRSQISEIFHFLITQNQAQLQDYYKDISFINLEEISWMKEVTAVLKKKTEMSLKDSLKQLTKAIQHESSNVRLHALSKLKEVLQNKRHDIYQMILSDTIDPIISDLMKHLLIGSREQTQLSKTKLYYAECLGELSAIDPGRLDIHTRLEIKIEEKEDYQMAFELISEYLVKAIRASRDTKAQDRAAYAIQELLKVCSIDKAFFQSASGRSVPKDQRKMHDQWKKIPDDIKEIIYPFAESTYMLKSQSRKKVETPYFSNSKTFRQWLASWTTSLIHKANDSRKAIFSACR